MKILLIALGLLLVNVVVVSAAVTAVSEPDMAGEIFDISKVEVKPKLIEPVMPVYPYTQSRAGLNGSVTIDFIIDVNGRVKDAVVIESNNSAFERPALDAVVKWKFSPGTQSGRPVSVRVEQSIEFKIDDGMDPGRAWRIAKPKSQASLPPILQWDVAPIPLQTAFPIYPFEALVSGVKGKARLRFVVGPEGRVTETKLEMATTPELGMAALAAIETWQFKPALKADGTVSYAALSMDYDFSPSGLSDAVVNSSARRILGLLKKHPEKIVICDQLDQIPKRLEGRGPAYAYPTARRSDGSPGEATIDFFIDESGDAQLPRIVSSTAPEFGYAAAQEVATWRFRSPTKSGKPVVCRASAIVVIDQKSARPAPFPIAPPHQ